MGTQVRTLNLTEPEVATIVLRHEQLAKFRRVAAAGGNTEISTDSGFARLIGVHPSQASRVLARKAAPGTRFIAGVIELFGIECFADLFSVEPDDEQAA